MLVHAENMAVNKNVSGKLSIYLFVFKIQQSAVKGTKMFMVSIRNGTNPTEVCSLTPLLSEENWSNGLLIA